MLLRLILFKSLVKVFWKVSPSCSITCFSHSKYWLLIVVGALFVYLFDCNLEHLNFIDHVENTILFRPCWILKRIYIVSLITKTTHRLLQFPDSCETRSICWNNSLNISVLTLRGELVTLSDRFTFLCRICCIDMFITIERHSCSLCVGYIYVVIFTTFV